MNAIALARDGDPPALAAVGESLRAIARNLADIAASVSQEATEATDSVRRLIRLRAHPFSRYRIG